MKIPFLKTIFLVFFTLTLFSITNVGFSQQTMLFQNGLVITCDALVMDADSMRGNIPPGTMIMRFVSSNGKKMGLNIETDALPTEDSLLVYDGATINAPILLLTPSQFPAPYFPPVESSGDTVTVRYKRGNTSAITRYFRFRIRCLDEPINFPSFVPVLGFTDLISAGYSFDFADYDGDGDTDVISGGQIMRNDSYVDSQYIFRRRFDVLGEWVNTNMVASDFDNDGLKDVFITGESSISGTFKPSSALYKNNGNGTFSRVTSQLFTGAYNGDCTVVDFNRDGKMDICYTGQTNTGASLLTIFKLYLNNGGMSFTDVSISIPGFSGMCHGSMSWADSEGDGDSDLLVSGFNGTSSISRLYIFSGTTFTEKPIGLKQVQLGKIMWVDINSDGKMDIVSTGTPTSNPADAIVPEILVNTGNNTFTNILNNLPAWGSPNFDWSDYDGDGDKDAIFCGLKMVNGDSYAATAVFKNLGNGNFAQKGVDSVFGFNTVKWIQVNNDAKPDIFISGSQGSKSFMLKNMGVDSFKRCSFPMPYFDVKGESLVEDFNNDGIIDLLMVDKMLTIDCSHSYKSLLIEGMAWKNSSYPVLTSVVKLWTKLPSYSSGFNSLRCKWGDYDSDGTLDVICMTQSHYYFAALRNNGNNDFQLVYNPNTTTLPGTKRCFSDAEMVDLDNDGIKEMFLVPNCVYKRNGANWTLFYEDPDFSCFGSGYIWNVEFEDFDNDGYKDAVVTGGSSICDVGGVVMLLKNDRTGRLIRYGNIMARYSDHVKWADFDNDGDFDFTNGRITYENRNNTFVPCYGVIGKNAGVAIGDFNNDGWKDMATVGCQNSNPPFKSQFFYNRFGSFFFKPVSPGKLYSEYASPHPQDIDAFDVDNDGDLDLLHSVLGVSYCGAALLINQNDFFAKVISVRNPNGGECFVINNIQVIKWTGNQIGPSVRIELSRDNGMTWELLGTSVSTPTGGSFSWNVTGPVSTKCRIRITDVSSASTTDISNEAFKISLVTSTGQQQISNEGRIKVFPNPANEKIIIEVPEVINQKGTMVVANTLGTIIENRDVFVSQSQPLLVQTENLRPGTYVVRLIINYKSYSAKFIKL